MSTLVWLTLLKLDNLRRMEKYVYDVGFALLYKMFHSIGVWLEMLESMWYFSEVNLLIKKCPN